MRSHANSTVAIVAVLLVGTVVPAAAAAGVSDASHLAQDGATPSLVVDLQADGSATVTLTLTYDLETDDERVAFQSLRNDSSARQNAKDRFRDRMADVAADASNATGREMSVSDPAIELSTTDDGATGVVRLSVTWTNLATERDGRLVVTEPFASGFTTDGQFTVVGPDGYELDGATPAPDATGTNSATWHAGADLSGFEVSFVPVEDGGASEGDDGETGASGDAAEGAPGFGAALTLVALLAAALLARRR